MFLPTNKENSNELKQDTTLEGESKPIPSKELSRQDDEHEEEGTVTTATLGDLWDSCQSLGLGDSFGNVREEELPAKCRSHQRKENDNDDDDDQEYSLPLQATSRIRITRGASDSASRKELLLDKDLEEDHDDDESESSYQEYEKNLFEQFRAFQHAKQDAAKSSKR